MLPSRAQLYAEVNTQKPEEYWDYKSYVLPWGNEEDYELGDRIGGGRYSEVFVAAKKSNQQKYIAKVLISKRIKNVKREVKILENLRGGCNIVKLESLIRDPVTNKPALIMEFVSDTDLKGLSETLSEADVRYYSYELLRALDFSHSMGVMHRDVKPQNVMVDLARKKLVLIDWGMAEFYHPGKSYSVHVATRFYKGPELLLKYPMYDYSIDMWSFGCILAAIVFKKDPFFEGYDDDDILLSISEILGSEEIYEYMKKYNIEICDDLTSSLGKNPRCDWSNFLNDKKPHLVTAEILSLMDGIFRCDHAARLTAGSAMEHNYYSPIFKNSDQVSGPSTSTFSQ